MLRTGFVFHEEFLRHTTGKDHPETPERLKAIMSILQKNGYFERLELIKVQPADPAWVAKVHSQIYINDLKQVCQKGYSLLDQDTVVGPESFHSALMAVGGVLGAVDAVAHKKVKNAFCALRPPGHHAERERAMGFCLFNNVAVAARYAQLKHKYKKILIIDWDVHHGNGTQNAFYSDDKVFYFSIHQYPHYPGSGSEDETGNGPGKGYTYNVPMFSGSGDLEYIEVFKNILYPVAEKFCPDFVFISAGFDGHKEDPLSEINLTEKGFKEMTEIVLSLADECCQGRVVSVLEGGYNLSSLAHSVKVHLSTLMDWKPEEKPKKKK